MAYQNAEYDEETESFVFHSKYNFTTCSKKLIAHFNDGGMSTKRVLAGVLEVSHATVQFWLDPNHAQYKRELKALVDELKQIAASETDRWHREAARGDRKDAHAPILNKRAEYLLGIESPTDALGTQVQVAILPANSRLTIEDNDE